MKPEAIKARELLNRYYRNADLQLNMFQSKIALNILIDEMIKELDPETWGLEMHKAMDRIEYLNKIKKELDKL